MNFNVYLRACLSDDSKENSGERILWRGIDGSVERTTGREKRDIEQRERKEGEPVEEREEHDDAMSFESRVCEDP